MSVPHLASRVLAAILLVLCVPLLALVAVLLLIVLGRPILFRQHRSGLHGAPFEMIKFRTMRMDTDAAGKLLPDDKRLGGVGRMLRRTRLDELPELFNIVRGEMAFIGPRPLLPETIASMGEAGLARGAVRPGLTGWAQVSGNTLLSNREKAVLDLWYVKHRNLALDLEILLRTPLVLLLGERRPQGALVDIQ